MFVVADENDRARETLQRVFEHVDRVDVQMVGRLVETEQSLGCHEHLCQGQAGLLSAREDADLLLDRIVVAEKERAKKAALLRHRPLGGDGIDFLQDRIAFVHALERVLGIVCDADVCSQVSHAGGGCLDARDHLHERRLAGAVWADERHVVASIELEVDVAVDVLVAIGLRYVLERDHHIARARRVGEVEVDVLVPLGKDDELAFDLLDLANALLGLCSLGGLVAKLVDKDLHMGDVALLGSAFGSHLLEIVLALLEIGAVVARVGRDTAVLKGGNVIHACVHERAVVADDQHGALVIRDESAQPLNAFEIQMVCGLVEQQKIGMAEKELGERDAHLPAA